MNGTNWILVLALALILGLGYSVHEMMAVDEAAEVLSGVQRQLEAADRALVKATADVQVRTRALEDLQKPDPLALELQRVSLEKLEVETSIDVLVEKDSVLRAEITALIENAQSSAPGHEFDDLALSSEKVIHGAILQKFDGAVVSLTHADGIAKIPVADLPDRVRNRLLLDHRLEPKLARTLAAEAVLLASKKSVPTPRPPPPNPNARYETPKWKAYLEELKAWEYQALNARLATQKLVDAMASLNSQRGLTPPGNKSMSGRYHAEARRYAIGQQVVELRDRIAAAKREETRIRALKPKIPLGL